jgi:hypothetical protein
MPIPDDLRSIAERAKGDLNEVHDFYESSKIVWRSFQILVDEGHQVRVTNLATGNTIDQDILLQRAPKYIREYLATSTFIRFVSIFEVFLFDFLLRLFRQNPWQFKKRELTLEAVLQATDREEIISGVLLCAGSA